MNKFIEEYRDSFQIVEEKRGQDMNLLEKEKIEEPSGGGPIPEMLLFFDITTCEHHDTVKSKK
jgi:hypothetical protein